MNRVIKLIAIGFLLVGCELTQNPTEYNKAPIVDAGVNKVTIINKTITITATATDSDGSIASYRWTEENGDIVGTTPSFTYTAKTLGNHNLTLTVTDNLGKIGRDFMLVTVTNADGSLNGEIIPSTPNTTPSTGSTGTSSGVTATGSTSNSALYSITKLGSAINIDTTISVGTTAKSVYLVLSNGSSVSYVPTISNSAFKYVKKAKVADTTLSTSPIIHHPSYVDDFNKNVDYYLSLAKQNTSTKKITSDTRMAKDVVGTSQSFYLTETFFSSTTATARKVVSNVVTNNGLRTLNIWVSNDSFGVGCSKAKCVTQTMVDTLANTFLKAGDNNDIYDWVTNIYGKEWGTVSGMIPDSREITILLTDIDGNNNPNGGVIGFYWSKDNFPKSTVFPVRSSNERLMFYIDSVMFANDLGQTWTIDGYWAKETLSTLAHEFQHMISFYQKKILLSTSNNVWLDELVSETTEDLVATKIRYNGPRNVVYTDGSAGNSGNSKGRFPRYNLNNDKSITSWSSQLYDYSKVSAFGTFLIRNYGGAKLLAYIQGEKYSDEQAIVNAVRKDPNGANKTFTNLLNEWGVAVILSDNTNVTNAPKYNTGDFTNTTMNGVTYQMGSINFFNYTSQPKISTTTGTLNPRANYFYKIGTNVTGNISLSLKLNGQTEATVVVK